MHEHTPELSDAGTMAQTISADIAPRADTAREVARRRTFGIISHPDAGKTTLTEKLLLFSRRDPAGGRGQGRARAAATPLPTGWRSKSSAASRSPAR